MAAATPFATYLDLQAVWRPLTADEQVVAAGWINQASQQIRDEVPLINGLTIDERIDAGDLSATTVADVTVRMVKRVMRNPMGARQMSSSIDDYTEAYTLDAVGSSGELTITTAEMNRLMGIRAGKRAAFEVSTAPDNPLTMWPTVPPPNAMGSWDGPWC